MHCKLMSINLFLTVTGKFSVMIATLFYRGNNFLCRGNNCLVEADKPCIVSSCPLTGAGIAQLVVLGLAVHSVAGSILLWGYFR